MKPKSSYSKSTQLMAVVLLVSGLAGVVAAICLLAGYAWAIGVAGALALIAGALLFDPNPPKPPVYPNNRGVR